MLDVKIETFLRVARLRSYTAAAESLGLTQPAVTQHIQKLEAHYGSKLVDSAHRTVRLTQSGELLYEYLSLQRANEGQLAGLMRNVAGPLRVGATLSIADYYLPSLPVEHLLTSRERIQVTVGNTARLLDALGAGELDCAFIEGLFDTALFQTEVFCEARLVPIVAANHPLLGRRPDLEALHAYPLILREPHSGTREVFENWLARQDDSPRNFARLVELGSFMLIKELVRRSQAVAFVYEAVARREVEEGRLAILDMADFHVTHSLRFAYRRGDPRSKELEAFFRQISGPEGV